MPPKTLDRGWKSMKSERELIVLSKTHTLEALAKQLGRRPEAVLRKAAKLGLVIRREGK
jgi:hypothetical protein